ncbi:hypothetical protein SIAM614_28791 [Stappia aggregata IAM 12614]|uniref:Uncharacterized protein n=1 Tax=Roseibium aggregatum (strain ATCC 25650 / DSM 13394 / JCM 20685 / NBRC 16684 / NCIMB 2208 / IAM 12614 / B1) TaxID=384765 RepID=A0P4C0_ROSAI|nr:hypothetical protein SIAM614_28791 [Stappia aggregata IAM 12614] [Roseibium aggregatum IAM 12614]
MLVKMNVPRRSKNQHGRIVVVVRPIVLMTMHGPENIQFQAMRMAMVFDHLQVFLDGIQEFRRMRCSGNGRPDKHAQTQDTGQALLPANRSFISVPV